MQEKSPLEKEPSPCEQAIEAAPHCAQIQRCIRRKSLHVFMQGQAEEK